MLKRVPFVVRQGVTVGLIGAGAVAAWFLLVDTMAGRPLYTPAVLGSAAFHGLRDPGLVEVGFDAVGAYTALHIILFVLVGIIASAAAAEARRSPQVMWLLVEFFVVFQIAFYASVWIVFSPLLHALAWINVAVGNLLAAATMGHYLWRAYPELRAHLTFDDAAVSADEPPVS